MAFLNRDAMEIYIDNIDDNGGVFTHTLSNIIDFVIKYNFQGGPEQPIRYLEMQVNKNDIDLKYPHLIDTIVEGKTRLLIKAVDGGTFVITKIWLDNNKYELVATGIEVTMNTATLSQDDVDDINATNLDPSAIIEIIFNRWKSNLNLTTAGDGYADDYVLYTSPSLNPNRLEYDFTVSATADLINLTTAVTGDRASVGEDVYELNGTYSTLSDWTKIGTINKITFKKDLPTLVAINMCALMDNAFIFFANRNGVNTFYYVSYDDINPLAYNPADVTKNGVVNIYPRMTSPYATYTKFDLMMFKQLIGMSSKSSEGSETIVNKQVVSVDGSTATFVDDDSTAMYGDYTGAQVMSDMIVTTHADVIAENIVRRYKDPTRSITIQMSEVKSDLTGSGWEESIPTFSYAKKIVDDVNNITLTNTHLCDGEENNFMLRLSTFIRSYPEMTSEYTFGVMKETTLSQELANKLTKQMTTEDIIDRIYPIGTIYITTNNVNPSNTFKMGTWQAVSGTPPVSGSYMWKRTA